MKGMMNVNQTTFVYYTEEQKEEARQIDIMDFLAKYEGFTFERVGHEYHCREHNSLVINADHKRWFWNSKEMGGHDAISYLQKIHNMDYPSAMAAIVGNGQERTIKYSKSIPEPVEKNQQDFLLPEKTKQQHSQLYAYLCKSRGIDRTIVDNLVDEKKLYQDIRNNCVFVGMNENNEPSFACVRSTLTESTYRRDWDGSDKRYAFRMDGEDKSSVFVFEAPIDAMSHATLFNCLYNDKNAYKHHTRISLAGSSDVSLEHYLSTNTDIKNIYLCLDTDKTGINATNKYIEKYTEKGYKVFNCPPVSKDYNQDLVTYKESVVSVSIKATPTLKR